MSRAPAPHPPADGGRATSFIVWLAAFALLFGAFVVFAGSPRERKPHFWLRVAALPLVPALIAAILIACGELRVVPDSVAATLLLTLVFLTIPGLMLVPALLYRRPGGVPGLLGRRGGGGRGPGPEPPPARPRAPRRRAAARRRAGAPADPRARRRLAGVRRPAARASPLGSRSARRRLRPVAPLSHRPGRPVGAPADGPSGQAEPQLERAGVARRVARASA